MQIDMNKTVTIKFTYEGKKYTKKAYLHQLSTGAFVENIKKNCDDFVVVDWDDEWGVSFYDDKYIFEIVFEINNNSDEDEYYTFNPKRLNVWKLNEDVLLDEIKIETLKVS